LYTVRCLGVFFPVGDRRGCLERTNLHLDKLKKTDCQSSNREERADLQFIKSGLGEGAEDGRERRERERERERADLSLVGTEKHRSAPHRDRERSDLQFVDPERNTDLHFFEAERTDLAFRRKQTSKTLKQR
jgi:hypothetical protein